MCVNFQLSITNSFRDMRGPQFTLGSAAPPARPLAKNEIKRCFKSCYYRACIAVAKSCMWDPSMG